MPSVYPGSLDSFSANHQTGEVILPQTDNDLADAVNKIQAELGTSAQHRRLVKFVADGATDNLALIHAERDLLPASGGTLEFPPGQCYVSGPIVINRPSVRLLGAGGNAYGFTTPSSATEIVSNVAGINLLTLGTTTSTEHRGAFVSNISFRDISPGGDQLAGAIRWLRMNNTMLMNVGAYDFKTGYYVRTEPTSANPQFNTLINPQCRNCLHGFQVTANSPDFVVFGGYLLGMADVGAGIGADLIGNSWRFYGTAIQNFPTSWKIQGSSNQFYGATTEKSATTNPIGFDVVSGTDNQFYSPEVAGGPYATKFRVQAGASRTMVFGYQDTTSAPSVDDSGVDTLIIGPKLGLRTSQFVEMVEMADPAAPAVNRSRLFTRDNGAGKTQLCVRFPTGVVQVISTEP